MERVKADDAYQAHAALVKLEQQQKHLVGNPYWKALRDTAFARFKAALEKEV